MKQLALWKRPSRLHRRLRQIGYKGTYMKVKIRFLRNANSLLVNHAMSNKWFAVLGLFDKGTDRINLPVSPCSIGIPPCAAPVGFVFLTVAAFVCPLLAFIEY